MKVYRFSISSNRVLPDGLTPNPVGIQYYNRLIDRLLAEGIEPLVTLNHYDLPQYVQLLGGWTNAIVQDYFRAYADVVFNAYGDRVNILICYLIGECVILKFRLRGGLP